MSKLHVKKGDKVLLLIGDVDKKKGESEIGRVLSTNPGNGTVIVENMNIQKKHKKARSAKESGGIVTQFGPINVSNLMVICPSCNKPTRMAKKNIEDKNVRVCKKCNAVIDAKVKKGAAKAAEKKAKSEDGEAKTSAKKPKAPKAETAKTETIEKTVVNAEAKAPVAKKESAPKAEAKAPAAKKPVAPKAEEKAE